MFIDYLKIIETASAPSKTIRNMRFVKGLNLIVDDTPSTQVDMSGNNVGKTTVLKAIDVCLGGDEKILFKDIESNRVDEVVKDFLESREVEIVLGLSSGLDDPNAKRMTSSVLYKKKGVVRTVNGVVCRSKEKFIDALNTEIFLGRGNESPSFRELIAHNIRYRNYSIETSLRFLNPSRPEAVYDPLFREMLGCPVSDGKEKERLSKRLSEEQTIRKRISGGRSVNDYRMIIAQLDNEISDLEKIKNSYRIDNDFARKMDELNMTKQKAATVNVTLSSLEMRHRLVTDSMRRLREAHSSIDFNAVRLLYENAKSVIPGLQKRFEELVAFHNAMLANEENFIGRGLPDLTRRIAEVRQSLSALKAEEESLAEDLKVAGTYEKLEAIIHRLGELYEQRGGNQTLLNQLEGEEKEIEGISHRLNEILEESESSEAKDRLLKQVQAFNRFCVDLSRKLFERDDLLSFDSKKDKNGTPYLFFHYTSTALGSGENQGEALCFDMAYTMFADAEHIACLHFLLNDKKELVHDNKMVLAAKIAKENNIQLVFPMLKGKIRQDVVEEANIVVTLSQEDKLFRIESGKRETLVKKSPLKTHSSNMQ